MELNLRSRHLQRDVLHSIFLLATLMSTSIAQSTTTTNSQPFSTTSQIAGTPTTLLTSIISSTNTNNATAASSSSAFRPKGTDNAPNTFNAPNPAESFPSGTAAVDSNSDDSDDQRSGLLNYYFVFLALFILLLVIGVYFISKRKRARKMAFRNSGQNALARDLDGWTGSRRWMHGHRREESRGVGRADGDEGLDEFGQAPPPYIAASKRASGGEAEVQAGPQIQIPLRTLSTNEFERPATGKPPGYEEVIGERSNGLVGMNQVPGSTSLPSTSTSNAGGRT